MPLSNRQFFFKSLYWSLIGSALFVALYLITTSAAHLLRSPGSAGAYVNGILFSSMLGNILGAGLVGWRVVEKYRHAAFSYWTRRYVILSILSLLLATAILYTPLTGLLALWGILAAAIVVFSLSKRALFKPFKKVI